MNWVNQKTGIINHYNEKQHFGSQPIRVLNNMIIFIFQNTHPDFTDELLEAFEKHGFSKTINIVYGEQPIKRTPYITRDSKSIYLDETFLSYLWCVCQSIYTLYIQTIEIPRFNKNAGYEKHPTSQEKIDKAYELFEYGKSLIRHYSQWDIDYYPNPEKYLAEERDYVEQPNTFYTEAVKYILCHEYIHAIKHIDEINAGNYENSHFVEFEKEADHEAIELIKKGVFPDKINELPMQIGITVGMLSMFYFKAKTDSTKHPNTEDRLVSALEQLNLKNDSECWSIALVGIQLWAEQFSINIKWNKDLTDKLAFYDIIEQIKNTTA